MTGSKEEARQLALDFYGPIFLLYSLYDSAEEKTRSQTCWIIPSNRQRSLNVEHYVLKVI